MSTETELPGVVAACLFRYWRDSTAFENDVYLLPKDLDEQVGTLLIPALGAVLAVFAQDHAGSTFDEVEGPFMFRCSCVRCRKCPKVSRRHV